MRKTGRRLRRHKLRLCLLSLRPVFQIVSSHLSHSVRETLYMGVLHTVAVDGVNHNASLFVYALFSFNTVSICSRDHVGLVCGAALFYVKVSFAIHALIFRFFAQLVYKGHERAFFRLPIRGLAALVKHDGLLLLLIAILTCHVCPTLQSVTPRLYKDVKGKDLV